VREQALVERTRSGEHERMPSASEGHPSVRDYLREGNPISRENINNLRDFTAITILESSG